MDREIVAKRLRPGVDALLPSFRYIEGAYSSNPETQRIGEEMAAEIKRLQDEEEKHLKAKIAARSSGQPVASAEQKWERPDRSIPAIRRMMEQRRQETVSGVCASRTCQSSEMVRKLSSPPMRL